MLDGSYRCFKVNGLQGEPRDWAFNKWRISKHGLLWEIAQIYLTFRTVRKDCSPRSRAAHIPYSQRNGETQQHEGELAVESRRSTSEIKSSSWAWGMFDQGCGDGFIQTGSRSMQKARAPFARVSMMLEQLPPGIQCFIFPRAGTILVDSGKGDSWPEEGSEKVWHATRFCKMWSEWMALEGLAHGSP